MLGGQNPFGAEELGSLGYGDLKDCVHLFNLIHWRLTPPPSVGRPTDGRPSHPMDISRTSVGRPSDVRRLSDVRRTSVGHPSDVRRTSFGRPSDVHRTSVGRPSDVRRTSVRRLSDLATLAMATLRILLTLSNRPWNSPRVRSSARGQCWMCALTTPIC